MGRANTLWVGVVGSFKGAAVCSQTAHFSEPSEGHRSVLAKLFPSTTPHTAKPSTSFDPTAPSVTLLQKLKKKNQLRRGQSIQMLAIQMLAINVSRFHVG